jgi:transposase
VRYGRASLRDGKSLSVSSADIGRLKALVQDRNTPQKHVWRAEIVLLTADGVGTNEIMRRTAKSKTCVWRWQQRFIEEGFDGLLRDKTRPSRIKPLSAETAERVVALTLEEPPGETTHWTGALMAKAAGLSVSSVQRIWRAHGLQPHRMRKFKRRTTHASSTNCATSSASMSIRRRTPSSCRWTKRDPMGADSDWRSGRVRLSNHPPGGDRANCN